MLLSDWYLERQERRIEAAKAAGREAGKVEGHAAGKVEGKEEVYREIVAWDRRRKEAEARGEVFTEPPPGLSNGDPT